MNKFKYVITIIISIIFLFIIINKTKASIALSFVTLMLPLYWILSKKINVKSFLLIFFIIYPILPSLAGINLGAGVPVLRAHRIAAALLLLFLISNSLFFKVFVDFFKSNIFTFNIVIFIFSMFMTAFFSYDSQATLFYCLSIIFEMLIYTVVIFFVFKTDYEIEQLINSLLISCSILCIFGLFEKISGYNFYWAFGVYNDQLSGALIHQIRDGGVRIIGPFEHSISYAAYIVLILPLFLYKFRNNFKTFNLFVLLVMSAIIASQSRSGILGAGIIFFLYSIFVERKNLILIFILAIPIIIYNAGDIVQYLLNINPFTTTSTEIADSSSARMEQIIFMMQLIKKNFAFGFGNVSANVRSVDNFYLSYFFQFGIIGLVSYLGLLLITIIKPLRIYGSNVFKDQLMIVLLISIIVFCVINSIVTLLSYHFIFYVYIGIISRKLFNKINLNNETELN